MNISEIISLLKANENPKNAEGMRRYGIKGTLYGISMPELRKIAKKIGTNHSLAMELWKQDVHEAKLLATLTADYKQLTSEEIDLWVKDFDSWDLCDQSCINLYRYSEVAIKKIPQLAENSDEFARRTAFSLIATMCVNKNIADKDFLQYFPLIEKYADDDRTLVYQSVDWAMRAMGKRSADLKERVLQLAYKLSESDNKICRYIAKQSIKNLEQGKKVSCVSLKEKETGTKQKEKDGLNIPKKAKEKNKTLNPTIYEFDAVIIPDSEIDAAWIEFPFDVKKEFGKGRVKVHATFDGEEYDGSLVKMGTECHIIGVLKAIRKKIDKQGGDKIHVTIKERE